MWSDQRTKNKIKIFVSYCSCKLSSGFSVSDKRQIYNWAQHSLFGCNNIHSHFAVFTNSCREMALWSTFGEPRPIWVYFWYVVANLWIVIYSKIYCYYLTETLISKWWQDILVYKLEYDFFPIFLPLFSCPVVSRSWLFVPLTSVHCPWRMPDCSAHPWCCSALQQCSTVEPENANEATV